MKIWLDPETGRTGILDYLVTFEVNHAEDADVLMALLENADRKTRYELGWILGKAIDAN